MSYEIIYSKQFVRLKKTGEIIPMLLAGSNNCYEVRSDGRCGRRSRSWFSDSYYTKGKPSSKPDKLMERVDAELRRVIKQHKGDKEATPADIRRRFGYYVAMTLRSGTCSGMSWDQYRNLYAIGIKKAKTIAELDALGINLVFSVYEGKDCPAYVHIKTEAEYFAELKKWQQWKENGGKCFSLDFTPHDTDIVLKRLRADNVKVPKQKTIVEQDHYFVLSNHNGNLIKYTSRGYRYAYHQNGGKKFKTEKEAETYRKKLIAKYRHEAETWQVKRINTSCNFAVAG